MSQSLAQRLLSSISGENLMAQLVRGALGVGGLNLLYLPLTLVTSIVLARGLGPAAYGQYSFVMAVITMLSLPVGSGMAQLVTREIAKYHQSEEWGLFRGLLRRANQWILLGSVAMATMIALFAARNASWEVDDRWTMLLLGGAVLPLIGLSSLRSATLVGLRNVFAAQLPEMTARPSIHLFLVSLMIAVGVLNPTTVLLSQITATAFACALGAWFLHRMQPNEVSQAKPIYRNFEWCRALVPFTLLASVWTLNGEMGILALGWLGTNEDVAALRIAMNGSMLVMLSLSIVNMVIGPHIARAYQDNDMRRLQRLSRKSSRAALAVGLPLALLLIFFGGPIVQLFYGASYYGTATLPLAILAFGQLINVAFGSVGMFLTMCGFERDTLAGQIIALLVSTTTAAILIPPLGAVGGALAVFAGLTISNIILAVRFVQRLGFRPSAF